MVRGEHGANEEVEIAAVAVDTPGGEKCYGLAIRVVRAHSFGVAASMDRSVGQLTELVGRVPLKELVRETTDLIERLCIEAALRLTGDNRASAAEMLGLSRQSLYVKMRRYDIISPGSDVD
jgi:DNA-binding NtrC family response regulator